MKVIYNTSNYPYYKIKFIKAPYTDDGFEEHVKNFHNLFNLCIENNGKMILIIDATELSMPPIHFITKQVKFIKGIKLLSKEYIAETIYITSAITKKVIDILYIYEKPVSPYIIFDKEEDAIEYLKDNTERFSKILELNNRMKNINDNVLIKDKVLHNNKEVHNNT